MQALSNKIKMQGRNKETLFLFKFVRRKEKCVYVMNLEKELDLRGLIVASSHLQFQLKSSVNKVQLKTSLFLDL